MADLIVQAVVEPRLNRASSVENVEQDAKLEVEMKKKKKNKKNSKPRHPSAVKSIKKLTKKQRLAVFAEDHKDDDCPLCLEKGVDFGLQCGHLFHQACVQQQLDSKWSGVRIGFGYTQCAMCRADLHPDELHSSEDILSRLRDASALRDKVKVLAQEKIKEDELYPELKEDERLAMAMQKLAFYNCVDCHSPYCGGLVDCGRDLEIVEAELRCQKCSFKRDVPKSIDDSKVQDLRCLQHGYKHAMFKCDSCCSIATWDCIYNHYCDRCHSQSGASKNYPCPGRDKCSLGIIHPPNLPAVHCQGEIIPFVIGCMKCIGFDQENTVYGGAKHVF